MTITMNLEIEVGVSFEEIASVLSVMGAEHAIESGYLTGNFKYSGVYFVFRCFSTPEDVAAEGVDVDWKAGMSGAFHCPIKYLLESSEDIKSFLTKLHFDAQLIESCPDLHFLVAAQALPSKNLSLPIHWFQPQRLL